MDTFIAYKKGRPGAALSCSAGRILTGKARRA
jgi:hypothetical protein